MFCCVLLNGTDSEHFFFGLDLLLFLNAISKLIHFRFIRNTRKRETKICFKLWWLVNSYLFIILTESTLQKYCNKSQLTNHRACRVLTGQRVVKVQLLNHVCEDLWLTFDGLFADTPPTPGHAHKNVVLKKCCMLRKVHCRKKSV